MIKANGSQIITKLLELEGVELVAGIPGGSILPLYDQLNKSNIRHVLVRHEQAAGFIAQGMTRSTGKPAVCMATSGPGAMNLLTAIADARCDSVPIIAFTGQVNSSLIGTDAFQEADTFGLSFPITKHSVMVKNAAELLEVIPKAFQIAQSGRPGPVLIDVPRDVQLQEVEFEKWPEIKNENNTSLKIKFETSKEELEKKSAEIAAMLLNSKKPVLYLGGGCNDEKSSEEIKKLLKIFDAAVVTSLMGIGAVSRSAENNFGMVGMHGSYAANRAIHDADVVFAMGVRFDDRATGVIAKFCPDAKIIHIDIDAAEINKILPSSISVVSDIKKALPVLIEKIENTKNTTELGECKIARFQWIEQLKKIFAESESVELGRPENASSVNPRKFIKEIPLAAEKAGLKESDIIVTTDVGQHQMWSAQYYPVEHPRQFLTSGSLGTMGFGLPVALGAALANPEKRIVCISGDGSILMNVQEMATLAELNLNVTVIVLQNGSLGMVRQQQEYLFDKNYSASIFSKVPDFLKVAEGFGIDGVDAGKDENWQEKAFAPGPHFVKLDISMDENVLPFVKAGSANIDALRN
ncbi:MAG: biosynthetic-type acetolactate synthase large subunit [Treponema sp.]|nr:biosynthetic-type acetolactate synthase large subunit [Spirochaetia bacterium]MDD7014593.1 biosynthetic-type acetolactate synthase large subunit [Spirochaetales bacterium]MDY4902137.1 biosynthetic-type acetolactate synthase large subunit [Treponema sp.]